MITVSESLHATTRKSIQMCLENAESSSRSPAKLLEAGIDSSVLVISRRNAVELIRNIPAIVAHQTLIRRLEVRPLSDRFEVDHFEERKHWSKEIERYLKQFKVDPVESNVISRIATEISVPLKKVSKASAKYILTGVFINDHLLNRTIAMATRDVWGYNTFSGLFLDSTILERMEKLDAAFNLQHCKSIIPVRVFCDLDEIIECVDLTTSINGAFIGGRRVMLNADRDIEEVRNELEEYLFQLVEKYPVLRDESPDNFGKVLVNFYTMSPKEMIKRLGPSVICCPFKVPKELHTDDTYLLKEWDDDVEPMEYDSFGHHPLIV